MKTERTDYAELRAALEAGPTPGPWRFINHNNKPAQSLPSDDWTIESETNGKAVCSEPQCKFSDLPTVCDGPYIAAANPEVIRALLAERDALWEALEVMVEMIEMNGFGFHYAMDLARAALGQKQGD